jgi:hypothetical protein
LDRDIEADPCAAACVDHSIEIVCNQMAVPGDTPPGIVDEVEERSPNAERGHRATVS